MIEGDKTVIKHLNGILKCELTAVNQFFLHARILEDWGVMKMAKHEYEESMEEMRHADTIIKRILLLGGLPNLQDLNKLHIGEDVLEILKCDLKIEIDIEEKYKAAIKAAEDANDYVTAELCKELLAGEEEHHDMLQTQIDLVGKIGLERYIMLQSGSIDEAEVEAG